MRNVKTEKFKREFDKSPKLIHDEPKMPNYIVKSRSNSILDQLSHRRAERIYFSSGVADLAAEQAGAYLGMVFMGCMPGTL